MSGLGTSRRLSAPKNLVTVGLWRTSIKPRQLKLDLRVRALGPALIQSEPNRLGPGLDGTPVAQNKTARLLIANGRPAPSGFVGARGLQGSQAWDLTLWVAPPVAA